MKAPETKSTIVTPQMAEEWLATSVYERQRKLAPWQVNRLATEIERGRFILGTPIHFGVLSGNRKLVNGQHTLAAIAKSGIAIRLTVLTTPVDNEDELGQLYGRHDRGRARTPSDAFLGMNLAGKFDLATFEVNALGPAVKYVMTEFRNVRKNNNEEVAYSLDYLAEKMTEWSPFAGRYFEQVREGGVGLKGAFRRAPVVAVGIVTMRYQHKRAIEFWGAASANDGLHKLDPRQALVTFLLKDSSKKGNPVHYARTVASAWNRFFDCGELQIVRPSDSGKIGVTIKGTPFKAIPRPGSGDDLDDQEARQSFQTPLGDMRIAP